MNEEEGSGSLQLSRSVVSPLFAKGYFKPPVELGSSLVFSSLMTFQVQSLRRRAGPGLPGDLGPPESVRDGQRSLEG